VSWWSWFAHAAAVTQPLSLKTQTAYHSDAKSFCLGLLIAEPFIGACWHMALGTKMASVTLVNSSQYVFQGISYQVSVYEFEDGYRAISYCEVCALQNFQNDASSTTDEAIESCGKLIRQHHSQEHG
jgi:hypothetical protein